MRVNIYAEEMTDRIEIIEKEIDGIKFEALRIYLYLPTTVNVDHTVKFGQGAIDMVGQNIKGPFMHRVGDDDSSAVTFWSRGQLRNVLQKAIDVLDSHHENKKKKCE